MRIAWSVQYGLIYLFLFQLQYLPLTQPAWAACGMQVLIVPALLCSANSCSQGQDKSHLAQDHWDRR